MAQVICPECGAKNDTRAAGYPFCVGCQNSLARCGYCRWFDDATAICVHPVVAGVFEVGEMATPPCVYHTPGERLAPSRLVWPWLLWVSVGLLALAVAVLAVGVRQDAPRLAAVPELKLRVEADYEGRIVGEPFVVIAYADNISSVSAQWVQLEVARRSLESFDIYGVSPEPKLMLEHGLWHMLRYPGIEAGDTLRIALSLVPRQAGTHHLRLRLVSSGNVFHGMTDQPIIVKEPGGDDAAGVREEERR